MPHLQFLVILCVVFYINQFSFNIMKKIGIVENFYANAIVMYLTWKLANIFLLEYKNLQT